MHSYDKAKIYEEQLQKICDTARVCPNFCECTHESCNAVYTMHMLALEAMEKTGFRPT